MLTTKDIVRYRTLEQLKEEYLPVLRKQETVWSDEINTILDECEDTNYKFAQLCGVETRALYKWKKGSVPRKRETFIRIGLAARFDEEKINDMLMRYGYSALYPKRIEDFVCIYVLKNEYDNLIGSYLEILKKAKRWQEEQKEHKDKKINTDVVYTNAKQVRDEWELRRYIEKNARVFEKAYQKVREHIRKEFVYIYKTHNVNRIAITQGWSASLERSYSELMQDKWIPTRNKLISIGFHMAMNLNKINALLKMAYMEQLNAQNTKEAVLIFILQDAKRKNVFEGRGKDGFDYDGLCIHAKKILEALGEDMPEECSDLYREVKGIYVDIEDE